MLETTIRLLEIQGYHATGLNQIVTESATPKGSIYFHFPGGKEHLVAEAILLAGERIRIKVEKELKEHTDLGEAIKAFVSVIACDLKDSDFRKGCPVAGVAMEASATHERLRTTCEQVYDSWFQLINQRLVAAGYSREEADSWTLFIWSSVEGGLLLSRSRQSTKPLETVANQLQMLFSKS
jgi:TetR/AcrR family transcriptional repressor of lmrAB and yxaGH operons